MIKTLLLLLLVALTIVSITTQLYILLAHFTIYFAYFIGLNIITKVCMWMFQEIQKVEV